MTSWQANLQVSIMDLKRKLKTDEIEFDVQVTNLYDDAAFRVLVFATAQAPDGTGVGQIEFVSGNFDWQTQHEHPGYPTNNYTSWELGAHKLTPVNNTRDISPENTRSAKLRFKAPDGQVIVSAQAITWVPSPSMGDPGVPASRNARYYAQAKI